MDSHIKIEIEVSSNSIADIIRKFVINNKLESLIGRFIRANDNSYIKCFTNGDVRGVGYFHYDLIGKEFVILSDQPYRVQVHYGVDYKIFGEQYEDMVRVISLETGKEYEVMFHEGWLVNK